MVRPRTARFELRIPDDLLVRLQELSQSKGMRLTTYIISVLAEHCRLAPRVRVDRDGRPSAAQYVDYNLKLERLFKAVDGYIEGVAASRGRTQFNKWASYIGGADPIKRTVAEWDKIFAKAESFGDIFHEKSENTTPNLRLAIDIKKTADMVDFLAGKDD